MTSFSLRAPWIGALLTGAAALAPHAALAQDCATDADCGAGYRCETYEYELCSGGGMCSRDGVCEETEVVCETSEYSTCSALPCETDADCPLRMACHQQSNVVCEATAAACRPDGTCDDMPYEEPTCWEEPGERVCTPRYQLPCAAASDCGAGFDCVESIYWVCTGGGMAGSGAGGYPGSDDPGAMMPAPDGPQDAGAAPDSPDDFECHEESTGQFYCQLQDLPCAVDADCPEGLECKEQYLYPPCMAGSGGAAAAGSGAEDDGTDPPEDIAPPPDPDLACPEPTVEHRCMPPEYYGGGMTPVPGTGGSGEGSGDSGGVADAGVDDTEEPPRGPGTGGAGTGGPTSGSDGEDEDDGDERPRGGRGGFGWFGRGCSASGPMRADPLSLLAFGLLGLSLRRRSRKPA